MTFVFLNKEKLKEDQEKEPEDRYFPSPKDLEGGRDNPKAWKWTIQHILPLIEPKFRDDGHTQLLRHWCEPTSEALAFVMMLNSYSAWEQEAMMEKESEENEPEDKISSKWTSKAANGRMFEGWSHPGVKYFNTLVKEIKEKRKTEDSKIMEKEVQEKILEGRKGKRVRTSTSGEEYETPQVDLPEGFKMPSSTKRARVTAV